MGSIPTSCFFFVFLMKQKKNSSVTQTLIRLHRKKSLKHENVEQSFP